MKSALAMTAGLPSMHRFDSSSDAVAVAVVLATILVSALCCAFLLNAGFYMVSLAIYFFGVKDPSGEAEAKGREHTPLRRYIELVTHSHVWLLAPTRPEPNRRDARVVRVVLDNNRITMSIETSGALFVGAITVT